MVRTVGGRRRFSRNGLYPAIKNWAGPLALTGAANYLSGGRVPTFSGQEIAAYLGNQVLNAISGSGPSGKPVGGPMFGGPAGTSKRPAITVDAPVITKTRKTNRNNSRRKRSSEARSGGFVKTRKYARKRRDITGVNYSGEFGGTTTNADMVTIGHSTGPTHILYRLAWAAVLKKLLRLADYDLLDHSKPIPAAGKFVMTYKRYTADTLQTFSYANNGTSDNFGDAVDYFSTFTDNSGSNVVSMEMLTLAWVPVTVNIATTPYQWTMKESRIRLDETKVTISAKSTFKMQNRSVSVEGEDETAVDNVPLYGKSYEAGGSGAYWINEDNSDVSFIADRVNGVIKNTPDALMKEPPKPSEFKGVVKAGKIRIDPGIIKTSSLSSKATHYLSTWYRMLAPFDYVTKAKSPFGRYRFFCIEKMLDPDHAANIKCAFEHNISINTDVKMTKKKSGTVQFYQATYGV